MQLDLLLIRFVIAILLMVYNLDAQLAFSIQSKLFEASDASIIGMSHAKTKLENDLNDVNALHAEKFFCQQPHAVIYKLMSNVKQLKGMKKQTL